MPTTGRGRSTGYRLGDWNALCDRCQKKFWASELREEWTGWMVCKSCWEPRHEQDFLKGHVDNPQVSWTRPDSNGNTNVITVDGNTLTSDNYIDINGDEDKTLTVGTSNGIQQWATTLTADRTVTLSIIGVQEMDRFTIARTAGGAFDLIIGSVKTASIPSTTVVEYKNGAWTLESYTPSGL